MTDRVRRLWQQPMAVLLAIQLVGVLLYPFMDESPVGRAALSSFGLVVLFLAVRAVRATPALTWVAVLLGVPIVVLTILEVVDPLNTQLILWASVLRATFYFYTSFALLRYMFRDDVVTTDELWATGATFTRRGLGLRLHLHGSPGHLAGVVQRSAIDPGGAEVPGSRLLFVSFTNLTSVGLSDITPVLPQARSWVMIEQVAGLMYVALVVSRIVGRALARQRA